MSLFPLARAAFARRAAGFAFVCALPCAAAAQSVPTPAPTSSPPPEIGRVVTSDRQDEPLDATARVTYVVTKAEMILHGYTDIASAIATVPGVSVDRYGASGAAASVTIRGAAANGVLVLVDGRPVSGAQIGAVDLAAMPTTGVERIEIVEGSGSTLYGSGASSGVINIITGGGRPNHAAPYATLEAGSFDDKRAAIETPQFAFSQQNTGNAYAYGGYGVTPGTRANADLAETTGRISDAGTFGAVDISGTAGLVSRRLGVPGSTDYLTEFARQNDNTGDFRLTASLVRLNATTSFTASGNRETLEYTDPSVAEGGPFEDFSTDANLQANVQNVVVSTGNRIVYGADLMRGVARNDAGYGEYSSTPYAQTAAYVQDSLSLGASRIYGGLRAEQDGGAGGAVTPALGGILGLGGGFSLRANAATAFRVPTAEDLTYPGFSNPDLKPERTQSFDVTLKDARLFGGASIGWFVQTGTDLIVLNPDADYDLPFGPGNEPLINEQQSSIAGLMFDVTTQPLHHVVTTLNVTDLYRALGYNDGTTAQRLAGRPVITLNLDVGYTGFRRGVLAAFGVVAHAEGARDFVGLANPYTRIDAYVRFRLAPAALLSVRGYNLGNEQYQEIGGYPMPGRAIAVELSTR
jgi:vitamin B12 transporter